MEYKIISMDFDGTLLNSQKKVSKFTFKTLNEARNKGYIIVGCTARTLDSVKDILPLETFDYLILNNGAYVYDCKLNEGTYINKIDNKDVNNILKICNNKDTSIDIISGTTYYLYKRKNNANLSFIKTINDLSEVNEEIARINIFIDKNKVMDLFKELQNKCPNLNTIIMQDSESEKKWIVVNPNGINKFVTLKNYAEKNKISIDEIIFFGDGLNDKEIISNVGLGVAMGNALNEIKKISKDIADTNDNDGIAKYLKKIM